MTVRAKEPDVATLARSGRPRRRGAVLLEVIVALVIFVAAAAITLRAASGVIERLDRAQREAQAADLAASLMAELDAGLITVQDLRDDPGALVGSFRDAGRGFDDESTPAVQWSTDVRTQRTEFDGLSLVLISVREQTPAGGAAGAQESAALARYALRQLVRLREPDPEAYEPDEILEDLPEEPATPDEQGEAPEFEDASPAGAFGAEAPEDES